MEVKSPAKKQVMDFVKTTDVGEMYEFEFAGTAAEAVSFIKRMRTELSRLRELVKATGRKLSRFKMMVVAVQQLQDKPPKCRVVLRKSDNGQRELGEYLDADLLKELTEEA